MIIRFAGALILVLASMIVGVVLMEYICRWIEPPGWENQILGPPRKKDSYYRYEPTIGWIGRPNVVSGYHGLGVRTNEFGMRSGSPHTPAGYRIAVMGDSYVWGMGMGQLRRMTERLEQELGVKVLNFGVSGYGPVQYLQQLDFVLRFKPNLVVLTFFIGNDFGDSLSNFSYNHYRAYATLDKEGLSIQGTPVPYRGLYDRYKKPWITHYALGRFLYVYYADYLPDSLTIPRTMPPIKRSVPGLVSEEIFRLPASPRAQQAHAITREILIAIQRKLNNAGVPLVMFVAPMRPSTSRQHNVNGLRLLQEVSLQTGIRLVQDNAAFTDADYLKDNDHWNAAGHAKAAKILAPVLRSYIQAASNSRDLLLDFGSSSSSSGSIPSARR